jgi:hypothetical protein
MLQIGLRRSTGLNAPMRPPSPRGEMRPAVVKLQIDVATITERVSHLPTKGWMAVTLGGGLALIAALVTFSEKIHALILADPRSKPGRQRGFLLHRANR